MQEFQNAHFARGQVRPESRVNLRARRIAEMVGAPVERVAAIMISAAPVVDGHDLTVFDTMRADHLEMLRLLACGESLTDVAIKIRRDFNPNCTVDTVRRVQRDHLAAFRLAVETGRLSADLSASTASRLSRRELQPGRKAHVMKAPPPKRPEPAEKKQSEINPARVQPVSAGHSRPVSQPQPAITGQPAELPATHAPWWAVRPNFSQPSAGQVSGRLVDYDRLTGRSAGGGQ